MNEVYQIEQFTDQQGRFVERLSPVKGGLITFYGNVSVRTPAGDLPVSFPFPETTLSIEECFTSFDDLAKKRLALLREEMQEAHRRSQEAPKAEDGVPAEAPVIKADFTPKE